MMGIFPDSFLPGLFFLLVLSGFEEFFAEQAGYGHPGDGGFLLVHEVYFGVFSEGYFHGSGFFDD